MCVPSEVEKTTSRHSSPAYMAQARREKVREIPLHFHDNHLFILSSKSKQKCLGAVQNANRGVIRDDGKAEVSFSECILPFVPAFITRKESWRWWRRWTSYGGGHVVGGGGGGCAGGRGLKVVLLGLVLLVGGRWKGDGAGGGCFGGRGAVLLLFLVALVKVGVEEGWW